MIGRTVHGLYRLIAALTAGLAVLIVLGAWRLSAGPLSLGFLSNYIERSLAAIDPVFRIELDDTILAWAGWNRTLDIRVRGVRAFDADGQLRAHVPELSLSLSARALVHGVVAPSRVEVFGPTLRILRQADGRLEFGGEPGTAGAEGFLAAVVAAFREAPDPRRTLSYLTRLDVVDADVTVDDRLLETVWAAPRVRLGVARTATGVGADIGVDLMAGGAPTPVTLAVDYRTDGDRLEAALAFGALTPAALAPLAPALVQLARLDLPVRGTAAISMRLDGRIDVVGFDLTAERGGISLPAPFDQRIEVAHAVLRGRYEGAGRLVSVEMFETNLAAGSKLVLPGADRHAVPLRRLALAGTVALDDGTATVGRFEADLDGPQVVATAEIGRQPATGGGGPLLLLAGAATLREAAVDRVKEYWPRTWGTPAWDWVTAHLKRGRLAKIKVDFAVAVDGASGAAQVRKLAGSMDLRGVTVDPLPPLPPVERVDGTVTFDEKRMDIRTTAGQAGPIRLRAGSMAITGLDKRDQHGEIALALEGPLAGTLAYLDHAPLGFAQAVGLRPERASGTARADLKISLPLERAVTLERVDVSAKARLEGVGIAQALRGLDLTGGALALDVDKRRLEVGGTIRLGSIPGRFSWRQNFAAGAPFVSRFELAGRLEDDQRVRELGLGFAPLGPAYVAGPTEVTAVHTVRPGGAARLEVTADLGEASLTIPDFEWSKPPGVPGRAEVGADLASDGNPLALGFRVTAADLAAAGDVRFAGADPSEVTLAEVRFGRNRLAGRLARSPAGAWSGQVEGASFDLAPFLDNPLARAAASDAEDKTPFAVGFRFDRVWLAEARALEAASGVADQGVRRMRNLAVRAETAPGAPIEIALVSLPGERRRLRIVANDGGAALRAFDLYDSMTGGALELVGEYDDAKPTSPLAAKLQIRDYRVVGAPFLTQALSLMALTGILERLQGEGLSFTALDADLTLEDGVLAIANATASGPSLGLTGEGTIYVHARTLAIDGTIVPAYLLNALLGRIPIVGQLFSGERGGGVFAATYRTTGSLDKPETAVNPLAALAPGILRQIFGTLPTIKADPVEDWLPGAGAKDKDSN